MHGTQEIVEFYLQLLISANQRNTFDEPGKNSFNTD